MDNVPPPPPEKPSLRPVASSPEPSGPAQVPDIFTTASIHPSMRTTIPPALRQSQSAEDPRQAAQSAVRQAAAGAFERPRFDRGPLPPVPTRSPFAPPNRRPGGYDVDIDVENGFTYVDIDEPASQSPTRRPGDEISIRTSRPVTRTQPGASGETSSDPGPGRGRGSSRSRSRGGSFGSGKPKGLSFYDAREYMRSGRGSRPGSWQEAPNGAAATTAARMEAGGRRSRSASRSRSRSPRHLSPRSRSPYDADVGVSSEGTEHDNIPPSPPPHGHMHTPPLPLEKMKSRPDRWVFSKSVAKDHFVATLGELLGTTMFLFFAFAATEVASINSPGGTTEDLVGFNLGKLLYVSFAFGFSLMVNVWIFFGVSEGLFNPAVTLALLLTGAIGAVRAFLLFVAQIVGGIAASAMVLGLFPITLDVQTTLKDGVSIPRGLLIEAVLTAELVFTILVLAKEKHRATFVAPLGIGFSLFMAELVGVYWTGGSLNPSRSLGPNIVTWKWESTHWIYWAGPTIGSLLAVAVYRIFKSLELQPESPEQDVESPRKGTYDNVHDRQRDISTRVLKSLGVESNGQRYGPVGYNDGESIGSIHLWHKGGNTPLTPQTLYSPQRSQTGGNVPYFGLSGAPVRRSEDEGSGWTGGGIQDYRMGRS